MCLSKGKAGRNASVSVYGKEISTEVHDLLQFCFRKKAGRQHLLSTYYVPDCAGKSDTYYMN